jgi:hypothetical protein
MDEFLALSSLLTGLASLTKLDPLSVESRMARDYFRLMKEQFGPGFESLLVLYRGVAAKPDPLSALLQDPAFKSDVETAARQLVNLWLLSQYGAAGKLPDQDAGFYEKGFVWPAIRAHAIGFSHQSYGYWSSKPGS